MGVLLVLAVLTVAVTPIYGLIGYDCGGGGLNVTTYSMLDVEQCNVPVTTPNETSVQIQLLQLTKYQSIKVQQCRVSIERTIFRCSMWSDVKAVPDHQRTYYVNVNRDQCKMMIATGTYKYTDNIIMTNLKPNTSNQQTFMLAGELEKDGSCEGATYSDTYGKYEKVIVEGLIEVEFKEYVTTVDIDNDKVSVVGRGECNMLDGWCETGRGYQTYWDVLPTDDCQFRRYKNLYEGKALKLSGTEEEAEVYLVDNEDTTFALTITGKFRVCGYLVYRTELPKVLIVESAPNNIFPTQARVDTEDLDTFLYINAKMIYIERHLRTQITNLYHHTRVRRCEIEREALARALALAPLYPTLLAQIIMKKPGYQAILGGELIHIISCTKIECEIRKTEHCYLELPVTCMNESYFLTPKTKFLIQTGTPIECSTALPTGYYIEGNWYYITPDTIQAPEPNVLSVNPETLWKYKHLRRIGTGGIYTQEDLEKINKRSREHAEASAIMGTIARGATGQKIPHSKLTFQNLFDKATFESFFEEIATKYWGKFLVFGSATSGLIGVLALFHVMKLVLNTLVQGYTIYKLWGWSTRLLGAIWESLTMLFIHQAHENKNKNSEKYKNSSYNEGFELEINDVREMKCYHQPSEKEINTQNKEDQEGKIKMCKNKH